MTIWYDALSHYGLWKFVDTHTCWFLAGAFSLDVVHWQKEFQKCIQPVIKKNNNLLIILPPINVSLLASSKNNHI